MARTGLRRGWTTVPSTVDLVIAVVAAAMAVLGTLLAAELQVDARRPDVAGLALVAVAGLALGWRRTAPVAALGVVVAAVAAYLLAGYPYGAIQLCMVLAMFEVARLRGLRVSLPACAVATMVAVAAVLSRAIVHADLPLLLAAFWTSWLVVPWSVGALVHVRAAATRRARQELVARATLEERIRVAGEVHDIAGHGFAAVAMQAGVALLVFDEQPAQAKESLEAIQTTSTKALTDLRGLLNAFHRREPADAGRAERFASEGLRDVAALVDIVRAAGLPVQLSAEPVVVPDEIDRVAYRVVQEALTNVLRHAGPTTAEVRVHLEENLLVVEVLDRGVGADELRPGLGLTGMRNRVAAAGGSLVTETRSAGGFRVMARLPAVGDAT